VLSRSRGHIPTHNATQAEKKIMEIPKRLIYVLLSIITAFAVQTFINQNYTFSWIQVLLLVLPIGYCFLGPWVRGIFRGKMVIRELWIFPIKSCGGIRVKSAKLDWLGFVNDRRYMVVKPDGAFITQRQFPKMRLIVPCLSDPLDARPVLTLAAPDMSQITVPPVDPNAKKLPVVVWESTVIALDMGDDVSQWLTQYLNTPARLVHIQPNTQHSRPMNPKYAVKALGHELKGNEHDVVQVPFTDAYPLHLITMESFHLLESQLPSGVQISSLNFRANNCLWRTKTVR